MGRFVNLAILVAIATCILVCSSAIVCESHLRFVAHFVSPDKNASIADEVCSTWALWMSRLLSWILREGTDTENAYIRTDGLFVFGVAFPFFGASTTVYILSLLQKNKTRKDVDRRETSSPNAPIKKERTKSGLGDPPIHWWSFLVLFLPTALICVDVLSHPPENDRFKDMPVLMRSLLLLANPFGVAACISLSFFLVPVSRGSYTVEWETDSGGFGWSWSPMHALVFHRWAGWFGAFFTGLHATIFCLLYIMMGMQYSDQNPLQALWSALVPGKECWPSWLHWSPSHQSASFVRCYHQHKASQVDTKTTMEECLEAEHYKEGDMGQCYGHWRNFLGTISALSFLVLCLTSISFIRRRYYSIFYKTHIVAGSMMLVFAILHFQTILMYLFPSMVYYLATTVPTLIHQYRSFRNDGVRIKRIKAIKNSGGCVEVTMPISSLQHQPFPDNSKIANDRIRFSSLSTPVYARVCVPSISAIWHPFSVMIKAKNTNDTRFTDNFHANPTTSCTVDSCNEQEISNTDPFVLSETEEQEHCNGHALKDDYEVIIFFRSVGPFTKAWANSLLTSTIASNEDSESDRISYTKTLLLDGFYPGAFPIPKILRHHDTLFLVAGGVGIVPFVSVLQSWFHYRKQEFIQQQRQNYHEQRGHEITSSPDNNPLPRKIVVYWCCREPGLVNHFIDHHLGFLLNPYDGRWHDDLNCSNPPSIDINCCLTRGGLANQSTFTQQDESSLRQPLLPDESSLPYTLPSHPLSRTHEDDEEEGAVPSVSSTTCSLSRKSSSSSSMNTSDATRVCHQDLSINDSPAAVGLVEVTRFDWMSFIVFALILWFSFLVQTWQYCRRILVDEATSVRLNSIYLTLLWSVVVALMGECFRAWHSKYSKLQRIDDDGVHDDSRRTFHEVEIEAEPTTTDDDEHPRLTVSSSVYRSALAGVVTISIIPGRPDFQSIIDPIADSDYPAVLLCGPEKLRETVRCTVKGDSICAGKCSVYEEVSEM